MSINHPLREKIDDEAAVDELARSQRFDRAVSLALHDLPVPVGLADRLIAAIATEPAPELCASPAKGEHADAANRRRPISRRQMLLAGGSLALVALIALSVSLLWRPEPVIAQEDLGGEVTGWLTALQPKNWRPATALPKGIALDPAVAGQPVQCQTFHHAASSGWSATVTAIDITPPGRPKAILFVVVVRSSARFAVPATPTTTTRLALSRGFMGTAWQRSPKVMYVLVVEEDRGQRLEDYLRKPPQA